MFDHNRSVGISVSLLVLGAVLSGGIASAQSSSPINFGGGQGSLTWSFTTGSAPCGSSGLSYSYWNFNNFTYIDPNGSSIPLSSSGAYIAAPGSPYCPPSGPQPSVVPISGDGFMINFTPGNNGQASASIAFTGSVRPKYEVMSVYYAPPGSKSFAEYSQTSMVGKSTTYNNSFQTQTGVTVSLTAASGILGTHGFSSTHSQTYQQQQDSSSSLDVSYQQGRGFKIYGPLNDADGLNHDLDIVAVWLNPVLTFKVSPGQVTWAGYNFDGRDPAGDLDVAYLHCSYLKNPALIPGGLAQQIAKVWDNSGNGGLTSGDLSAIADHDRFCKTPSAPVDMERYHGPVNSGTVIPYSRPPEGGQPPTWYWNFQYQATNTQGRSAKQTTTNSFSTEFKYNLFFNLFSATLKNQYTVTSFNQWSTLQTQKTTQNAVVSVTGPAWNSGYNGPSLFHMYQDNIYGTYMIAPVQ